MKGVITLHVENLILELKEEYKRENDLLFHLDDLSEERKDYEAKLYKNQVRIAQLHKELETWLKK